MNKNINWSEGYLKDWLQFRYEQENIPGFVVAVAKDDEIKFLEAFGFADLENKTKMSPKHIFRIASHSKTFTATAIMQLQERGKLRIDDLIIKYLPWLEHNKDKRWQKVTIRQLLSHGAGVVRDGKESDYWQLYRPFPSARQFKQEMQKSQLVLSNNTKMKYSNYGYTLLGLIVESASGLAYNKYVVENIVKPLGIKNTGPELNDAIKNRLVTGYTAPVFDKKRKPIAQIDTKAMSAATGFYSTAEDLCQYFTAHMMGSGKLLDDESKKEMQKPQWQAENVPEKEEYGLGFEMIYVNDKKLLGHGGSFPGHITRSLFDPEDEWVVVVLTNGMRSWAEGIAKGVMKTITKTNAKEPVDKKLLKYAGSFMSLWNIIDFVPAGKKLFAAYPNSWEPLEYPDELEFAGNDSFKIIKTSSFANECEEVKFNFDKSGKIKSVTYAGETLLPRDEYITHYSKASKISLPN